MTYEESTFKTLDLPNYTSIPEDSSIVYSDIVRFLKYKTCDNFLTVEDLEQFIQELEHLQITLSKVQQQASVDDKTWIKEENTIVKYLKVKMVNTKEFAEDFMKQDKKQEKQIKWMTIDRPLKAKEFRQYIEMDLDALLQRIVGLHFQHQLNNASKKQDITSLRKFMTDDYSYFFWVTTMGQKNLDGSWQKFIDSYQVIYGKLDVLMLQSMENLLCDEADHKRVTIQRFIMALQKFNNQFPFPKSITSNNIKTSYNSSDVNQKIIFEEKRMQLTKVALDLVEKFSEATMRDHLVTIYSWYTGYDKKNKEVLRERANEWGSLVKERRDLISENKQELIQVKHEQAELIDQARRAIYFFYEQFVTIWRVGEVTREILKDINFPGKGRIRDFLSFVAPLDQANFYIVMGMEKENDSEKDYLPKVYKFMDMYLDMLVQESKERDEYKNRMF
ncbi:hypothetical protein BDA99DRAFT_498944 [Phascolomyces articulosus]|uniref:Uncharacterized protein n=1 Tax=Phascolomyces articulosus TaxID=60185 RepID=A0AAD5K7K5_9FUNG|nr:hypothetical protein BDA99DRAFT_498944 [Phascolomyces articulosus]